MASTDTTTDRAPRTIDASTNRAAEGLRVLEDVARLLLDDARPTE